MSKNLGYIREALRKDESAMAEVFRQEGDKVKKIKMKASLALKYLEMPMERRPAAWKVIFPIGHVDPITLASMANSGLSGSAIAEELEAKDKELAELKAKLAELESKKPGRKSKAESGLSESGLSESAEPVNEEPNA